MKIAITVIDSVQVTHDEWKKVFKTKVFEENSTVLEINEWIKSIAPNTTIGSCVISTVLD